MEEHVISQKKDRKAKFGNHGFTLIEILIVVMVLGILAMVIVPQITVSTQDAKESTLETNMAAMRNAVELYYVQHNNVYPGHNSILGAGPAIPADAKIAFVQQLTQYTDINGVPATTKTTVYEFGPYIKNGVLPANPLATTPALGVDVTCDTSAVITAAPAAFTTGWYFFTVTGRLVAYE